MVRAKIYKFRKKLLCVLLKIVPKIQIFFNPRIKINKLLFEWNIRVLNSEIIWLKDKSVNQERVGLLFFYWICPKSGKMQIMKIIFAFVLFAKIIFWYLVWFFLFENLVGEKKKDFSRTKNVWKSVKKNFFVKRNWRKIFSFQKSWKK